MMEITPQEKLALTVLAALIAAGTLVRHAIFLDKAEERLAFTAEVADTLNIGETSALRARVASAVAREESRSRPLGAGERIDPNTAAADELDRLPRVGAALAERIVEYRNANGRFATLEELGEVSGVGPALLSTVAPHLTLRSGGSPRASPAAARRRLDINRASASELEGLPGVGPSIAARIVAYRDSAGPFRSSEDLENVSGIGPALRQRIESAAGAGP